MMVARLGWKEWIVLLIKSMFPTKKLIPSKYIPGIYLILYIIQTSIITVGDDSMALSLKCLQVIEYFAAKEGDAIYECWLINDYAPFALIRFMMP